MDKYYDAIYEHLKIDDFNFPITYDSSVYFPDFVSQLLEKYISYYENTLLKHIDLSIPFIDNVQDAIISKIKALSDNLKQVVQYYYEGNLYKATELFNITLDTAVSYETFKASKKIDIGKSFYRARISENSALNKTGLFHISFENRHFVSTNRYSVPGFPALYLGDNVYTCWEEFNRPKLRSLWVSRFENVKELEVIQLQRMEDFLLSIQGQTPTSKVVKLLSYLVLHPLNLLCSIKVIYPHGNFKPEYIIPQLLLQYVSQQEDIDGIMFPSTKIDYSKLHGMSSYNYVFPVKEINRKGFCKNLMERFHLTEPTSLEIEEIIYNPTKLRMTHGSIPDSDEKIELVNSIKSAYNHTSFGKLENSLKKRGISIVV